MSNLKKISNYYTLKSFKQSIKFVSWYEETKVNNIKTEMYYRLDHYDHA